MKVPPFFQNPDLRFKILLAVILLLGLVLRFMSFDFGLLPPASDQSVLSGHFYPSLEEDEKIYLAMIKNMDIFALDMDPDVYYHGPIIPYLWEISLGVGRIFGLVDHEIDDAAFAQHPQSYRKIILAGRINALIIAIAFLLTVAFLFRKWLGPGPSLLATAFLAVAWEPVTHSHVVRHDVPLALCLLFMIAQGRIVAQIGRRRDYLILGALWGLAIAIIHIAGISLGGVIVFFAHLQSSLRKEVSFSRHFFGLKIWQTVGLMLVVFALLVPSVFYRLPQFFYLFSKIHMPSISEEDIWRVTRWTQGFPGFLFLIGMVIPHAIGYGLTLLGLVSVVFGAIKRTGQWLLLWILPVMHIVMLTILTQKFTRHIIFIAAPIALLSARFLLVEFKEFLTRHIGTFKAKAVVYTIAALVFSISLFQTLAVTYLSNSYNICEQTTEWFLQRVPPKSTIAFVEHAPTIMVPPFDERFEPTMIPRYRLIEEVGRDIDSLEHTDAQFLVATYMELYGLHRKYMVEPGYEKERKLIEYLESGKKWERFHTFDHDCGWLSFMYDIDALPLDIHGVNLRIMVYRRIMD